MHISAYDCALISCVPGICVRDVKIYGGIFGGNMVYGRGRGGIWTSIIAKVCNRSAGVVMCVMQHTYTCVVYKYHIGSESLKCI